MRRSHAGGANSHDVLVFITDEVTRTRMSDEEGTNGDVNAIAGMDFEQAHDTSSD
jgi:hypothetical protein